MQAELMELEARFREQAAKDSQSEDETIKLFSRDWYTLSSPAGAQQLSEQWTLALEIRDKLEKYETTLLRHRQLSNIFQKPQKRDLDIIVGNLDNPQLPDYLLGLDSNVWKDENFRGDLISVNGVHDFDTASKWLIRLFLEPYHRFFGHRRKEANNADAELYHYDNAHLEIPANIISIVLSSVLPVLSIVVLYIVRNMPTRLGLVALFTAAFSLSVAVLTKARRVDVFTATAA
ncbi:hypothetical protein LTR84_007421 [Exophiala bonariae]|uniref:DUF6594 domain-containing protein n=1 Tax=Exophiala bonariae TaxID=1690606 RepID=A0AAV9MZD8_9EURO|nr:hypothetical protein LTR84_007421 [Exophiala bonariae]